MARRGVIPKVFHKSEGGLPEACIMCNQNLLSPPQDYLIEKSFRAYPEYKKTEVIFEYAMCLSCAHAMHNELSVESRQRIEAYFAEHVNLTSRNEFLKPKRAAFKNWISNCLVKRIPLKKSNEYTLYGLARGRQLIYDFFPYALSGEAMEEISELLSKKTREVLDGFIGKHFSGPPEVAEILKRRPVLI